nr:uncharacterized protein LOC105880353 [Microcebus murinus]XP_012636782.1 uncharacterized protein LOC105880353 [Microcebus murinus]
MLAGLGFHAPCPYSPPPYWYLRQPLWPGHQESAHSSPGPISHTWSSVVPFSGHCASHCTLHPSANTSSLSPSGVKTPCPPFPVPSQHSAFFKLCPCSGWPSTTFLTAKCLQIFQEPAPIFSLLNHLLIIPTRVSFSFVFTPFTPRGQHLSVSCLLCNEARSSRETPHLVPHLHPPTPAQPVVPRESALTLFSNLDLSAQAWHPWLISCCWCQVYLGSAQQMDNLLGCVFSSSHFSLAPGSCLSDHGPLPHSVLCRPPLPAQALSPDLRSIPDPRFLLIRKGENGPPRWDICPLFPGQCHLFKIPSLCPLTMRSLWMELFHSFRCQIILHCMDITHFPYPFISGWIFELLLLFDRKLYTAVNIRVQVLCGRMFSILLDTYLVVGCGSCGNSIFNRLRNCQAEAFSAFCCT